MSWSVGSAKLEAVQLDELSVDDLSGNAIGLALLPHDGRASRNRPQVAESRHVVSVHVGVDGDDEPEIELGDELKVLVDVVSYRVDEQRLSASAGGEEVGVGARLEVEELAKQHQTSFAAVCHGSGTV